MPRIEDLSEVARKIILGWDCPSFETKPLVSGPPLKDRRVALVTTAGLHKRDDQPFQRNQIDLYRVIPGNVKPNELVMSHMATSFDRSGFQRDCNVVFPLDRLREMVSEGLIGGLADFHYSFGTPVSVEKMRIAAREIADLFMKDNVNAVLLFPV
jgi:D-proline reductase (dithiol) PrdB